MAMLIAETVDEVRSQTAEWKKEGRTIGLVPTMGYLHEGHLSLVKASVDSCEKTVVSVFVNPTQFGPNEDLETYPRDFDRDCALLEAAGADLVFHPEPAEMYPEGFATYVEILSEMPRQLCGKSRPTHFRGVCTVVCKLFNIVAPDRAFFGEKDAQQLAIVKKMARELCMGVEVVGCPTVREPDGLAKSSRNFYLNAEERQAAPVLSEAIAIGKQMVQDGQTDADRIVAAMRAHIEEEPLAKIDYVSAVDAVTMMPVGQVTPGNTLFAMAVYIGKTRLIDNVSV